MNQLAARLRAHRRRLDQRVGEARTIALAGRRAEAALTDLQTRIELHEQAAALLSRLGETRQAAAQQQIEQLVTQGLRAIFDTDLSFHLAPTTRANTPVIDFIVRSHLGNITVDTDVMDARGGGLAAVVGFLLKVVVLLLSDQRRVLLLDETFAHVSAEYEPRVAEFLRELVDKAGVQVIMVTHSDAYAEAADVRYRFNTRAGITQVTAL